MACMGKACKGYARYIFGIQVVPQGHDGDESRLAISYLSLVVCKHCRSDPAGVIIPGTWDRIDQALSERGLRSVDRVRSHGEWVDLDEADPAMVAKVMQKPN